MWRNETKADIKEREAKDQKEYAENLNSNPYWNPGARPNHDNIKVQLPSWEASDYVFKSLYGITYILTCCGCCSSIDDFADFVRGSSD